MKPLKKMAIWMDYSKAHIIEFTDKAREIDIIEVRHAKNTYDRNPQLNHQNQVDEANRNAYFKKLTRCTDDCDKVLLFGPTHAKNELSNLWLEKEHCSLKNMEIITTGRLTEQQRCRFVNNYFINRQLTT
ncbi:MAG: hypothetical protein RLZZ500_531 [Bacteroidota bacterium]|jgi:hypothetical protein